MKREVWVVETRRGPECAWLSHDMAEMHLENMEHTRASIVRYVPAPRPKKKARKKR